VSLTVVAGKEFFDLPFTINRFIKTRPILYHLTDKQNVQEIIQSRILHSASSLMQQSNDHSYLSKKRKDHISLTIGTTEYKIRDQKPLHSGNISLEGGWSFEDVIRTLNERVFFWPGKESGPISYGVRHFERYLTEKPSILRISTSEMFDKNPDPYFCPFNSGSPRCTQGSGSPRGPQTFLNNTHANYTASKVVEVTFINRAVLPERIEIADSLDGPWQVV
jgi:hypothetical protein